jgi:hypothetical protein
MRKIVNVSKKKSWFSAEPDLELLNQQIEDIEKEGWKVISIATNYNLFGAISSYSLLLEYST